MKTLLLAFLLVATVGAHAQEGWRNQDGSARANTDSSKSVDGFAGLIIVTPDADWQKKWDTPAETAPAIQRGKEGKARSAPLRAHLLRQPADGQRRIGQRDLRY